MTEHTALRYRDVATRTIGASGTTFAYREYGSQAGVPLVLLTHLGGNLDNWDPAVVDGLADERHVIAVDYRGVGASAGTIRDTIEQIAADTRAVIRALGYDRVDVFGLSMGGMVAQAVAAQAPELVDRLILAATGPAGGPGLTGMTRVAVRAVLRAVLTFNDPKTLLFFTRSKVEKSAAHQYIARLKDRVVGRDDAITPAVYRAQLSAVHAWGAQAPADLSALASRVLIVHGDNDRMVPPANATVLVRSLPDATLTVFPDSGHGVVFQNHRAFVDRAREFLRR